MYKAALEVRRSASTPVLQSPNGPQSSLPPAKPVAFSFWPAHALGSFILREGNRISKHGSARADRSRREDHILTIAWVSQHRGWRFHVFCRLPKLRLCASGS